MKTTKGNFAHFKSFKTLFCFIIGKLPQELLPDFVTKLNELIVRSSYNPHNMDVARIDDLQSAMSDLVKQARSQDLDQILGEPYRFVHPALLHLGPSQKDLPHSSENRERVALQVSGTVKQDNSTLFKDITHQVRTLNNVYIAEIKDIPKLVDSTTQREFARALYQSPIVSLRLDCVTEGLTTQVLKQVPSSLERLTIFCDDPPRANPNTIYRFLPIPNLKCLHLLNCRADLSSASFPKLRTFILSCSTGWKRIDATTLHTALLDGKLGLLSNLDIFFTSLKGSGPVFADILKFESLRNVQLVGVKFSLEDGRFLLRSLEEGKCGHLRSLSLLNNKELAPVAADFQTEGEIQNTDILIDAEDSEEIGCLDKLKEIISKILDLF